MTFRATVKTSAPWTLAGLQAGQWIDYDGTRGRYVATRNGIVYIAWGKSASHRFPAFVAAVRALAA